MKEKDAKMAAANDKDGQEAAPFNDGLKKGVEKVMGGIKEKKKRLPSVVVTDERRTVQVKYEFTEDEKKKIGQDLAQRQIELVEVEDEKKAVMSSFTERIKAKKIDINRFSRQMRDGWEYREHQAILIFDYKKKIKKYRDVDSNKIVKTEPFSPGDEQRRFA